MKYEILADYKKRSVELVSRHMNGIAALFAEILCDDDTLPFSVPDEHRREFQKFRGNVATNMWTTSPERNTNLRSMYEEIAHESHILLCGPHDDFGAVADPEDMARWIASVQRTVMLGFNLEKRIIALNEVIDDLVGHRLTPAYTIDSLLYRQGIISAMFAAPPAFTEFWKESYTIWAFVSAAVEIVDNSPEIQYFGAN